MINLYDIAYALGVSVSAPVWGAKAKWRKKVLDAFSQRMGHVARRASDYPAVMIHAVSLGEMNATRMLVRKLREARPELHFVISSTTTTGYARAVELYGPDAGQFTLLRYPLDFTPAVTRVLDNLRPAVVVLMELEVWPNFIRQCHARGIPVIVVNGRMTAPSARKYRMGWPVVHAMFRRLSAVCAQEETYKRQFEMLGAPNVTVTGTMKFDTATVADRIDGDRELADALGLRPQVLGDADGEPIWVCGSTGPGEEEAILRQFRKLLESHPRLRLVIVPRQEPRFDEVAALIEKAGFALLRRSKTKTPDGVPPTNPAATAVILGDTFGELRKFYSLADVVFVGRTLLDLGPKNHGSDMIEPAALKKPVIVGRWTGNFADVMSHFRAGEAMREIDREDDLGAAVATLLASPDRAREMGERAQAIVKREQGATDRNVHVIVDSLAALGGSVKRDDAKTRSGDTVTRSSPA
jgi:3-deoxy-D-manno-octulosonic-acid transferase